MYSAIQWAVPLWRLKYGSGTSQHEAPSMFKYTVIASAGPDIDYTVSLGQRLCHPCQHGAGVLNEADLFSKYSKYRRLYAMLYGLIDLLLTADAVQ